MKKLILLILSSALVSGATLASEQSPKELVIQQLIAAQSQDFNPPENVQARVTELQEDGFVEIGATDATLIGGGCGFAGCDEVYLVTTAYSTLGANTQTAVLAAVVEYASANRSAKIQKVLSQEQVQALLE